MAKIERVHDLQVRTFKFTLGDSWNLHITTDSTVPDRVQIGLQWRNSHHYAHAEFFQKSEVLKALQELGIIDAQASSKREDPRESSVPSSSADAGIREGSCGDSWQEEELPPPWSTHPRD